MQRRSLFAILVVDNDEDDCFLIERGFRSVGVQKHIFTVRNGEEAIAFIQGSGKYSDRTAYPFPSLIMTDLKMPNGDGFDVLGYLHNHPNTPVIPIIVFSESTDGDDIRNAFRLGASAYHTKPGTYTELQALLKSLVDYWRRCLVPEANSSGRQVATNSYGRIGARFSDRDPPKRPWDFPRNGDPPEARPS